MRSILVLAIVALACFTSFKFGVHHTADSVFIQLYKHLEPAALVWDNHVAHDDLDYIVSIPLVGLPATIEVLGNVIPLDFLGDTTVDAPRITLFNLQVFQVASVLLCLICFLGVTKHLHTGKGDFLTRIFTGFAMWIRDEMVYPEMGKELGKKFLPYFLSIFFFILFMNVMGLVPYSATATASIYVTAALALTTFLAMIICGMVVQGPLAFWKNLVPHVPLALWPLMFIVELIGLLVKPFALMIRLFANMTGGHMVVLSFMGLIFFFGQPEMWGAAGGWGSAPVAVGFAVFIMIIEAFVALLQAYIFTQLSIIFINAAVHPEH